MNKAAHPASIHALTGVRFFAALFVLLFHYGATYLDRAGAPEPVARVLHNGYLGVSLFFVLSGYILTYAYENKSLNSRFIIDFLVSRVARIYPVYLFVLLIALPATIDSLSRQEIFSVLLMIQSWTLPQSTYGYAWVMQAWTLSVELFFYMTFPFIFFLTEKISNGVIIAVTLALSLLIVHFGLSSISPGTSDLDPLISAWPIPILRSAEFFYGVALRRITQRCPQLSRRIGGSPLESLLLLSIVFMLSISTTASSKAIVTILFGILIVQLSGGYGLISRFLSSKTMILLGGASYAVYLLQGPMRAICVYFFPHPVDRFISPVLTIAGAILLFKYLEQPVRRAIIGYYEAINSKIYAANQQPEV